MSEAGGRVIKTNKNETMLNMKKTTTREKSQVIKWQLKYLKKDCTDLK